MKELQHKQKLKRRLYSDPMLIGLLLLTVLFIKGAYGVLTKEVASRQEVAALTTQSAALADKERVLQENIQSLHTEAGVDEEIKQRFNVSAEGEHVALIVDRDYANPTTTATSTRAWYKRAWSAILSSI